MRFIDIVFSSLSLVTAVRGSSSSASQVTVHVVQVGPDGQLSFSPENVQANPGDMVQYQFHPKVCAIIIYFLFFAFLPSGSSASQCNSFRRGPTNHPSYRTTRSSNQRSAVLVCPSTMWCRMSQASSPGTCQSQQTRLQSRCSQYWSMIRNQSGSTAVKRAIAERAWSEPLMRMFPPYWLEAHQNYIYIYFQSSFD